MKEYLVQFRIKNNYLHQLMESAGIGSLRELSRQSGVGYSWIVALSGLKAMVVNKSGLPVQRAMRLAEFFNCLPENLAPEKHLHHRMEKTTVSREFGEQEIIGIIEAGPAAALPSPEDILIQSDRHRVIEDALKSLPSRSERIVRMKLGFDGHEKTFAEIGEIEGCTGQRIRQLYDRAMSQLRAPRHSRLLRAAG